MLFARFPGGFGSHVGNNFDSYVTKRLAHFSEKALYLESRALGSCGISQDIRQRPFYLPAVFRRQLALSQNFSQVLNRRGLPRIWLSATTTIGRAAPFVNDWSLTVLAR
jgi:hypothetical protein